MLRASRRRVAARGKRGRLGSRLSAPLLIQEGVGGFVPLLDTLLQPGEYFLFDPSDPTEGTIPETQSARKDPRVFEPLDVLRAIQDQLLELALGPNPHRGISR